MQAAVLERFGDSLVIEDVDVAEAGPDEVLIRTAACGVCHSDRTIQLGAQRRPLPFLLAMKRQVSSSRSARASVT